MVKKQPLVTDIFELYGQTSEILLWKSKDVAINSENLLENIFILSSDLASYFEIKHSHLLKQNISKLQKEGYLPKQLPKVRQLFFSGNQAKRFRTIYAFTRHQTEYLIMDFSGTKARNKKFAILKRLHDIEINVLQGSYEEARKKAQNFDGIELLKDLGFNCSVENRLATKKDITIFLKIPESTLTNFLRKNQEQIKPIPLDLATIRNLGSTANRMNAYNLDDVLKICFWMQSEMGVELKRRLLGETSILLRKDNRKEIEWRVVLAKILQA